MIKSKHLALIASTVMLFEQINPEIALIAKVLSLGAAILDIRE